MILAIIGLLQCNYSFAYDWAEVDGLRYEYIEYDRGYGLVAVIGYSSSIPENLTFPTSLKIKKFDNRTCRPIKIASGAFKGCTKLKSVNTSGVEDIENNAFENCISLQKVAQSVRWKKIGSKAFAGCTALDTIYYVSGVTIAEDAFDETTYQNAKLIVDDKYRDECNSHAVWSKFKNKIYQYSISVYASYGRVSYNGVTVENDKRTSFVEKQGSSITLSFMPEEGRELANLIIDGEDVTSKVVNNQYTIDNVSKSMDIQVSFFSITISAKGNGHVLCKQVSMYNPDYSQTELGDTRNGINSYFVPKGDYNLWFYIYPDEGYQLNKVLKDGIDITSDVNINYPISSTNIKYSATLEFTFEEIPPVTYTLSVKSIGNGSASYNGTSVRGGERSFSVEEGKSPVISFAPDTGHRIKSVKVNGTDVTSSMSDNKYTIENISADTSLEVEFEPILHTLTISSSGFGEASYNGISIHDKTQTFSIVEGTSLTITFTPEAGYRIANVKLDGTDVTASVINNTYTIRSISADMTLSVTFEVIPPSIDITKYISVYSAGGSISRTNNLINSGSQLNWQFSNNSDYGVTLKSLQLIDGATNEGGNIMSVNATVDAGSSVAYSTTIGVLGIHTPVTCRFKYDFYGNEYSADAVYPISYTLTIKSTGGGYAKYLGTTIRDESKSFSIEQLSSPTIYFTPDDGYRIKSLLVDGKNVTSSISSNSYSINLVTGSKNIEVEFEAIPPTYTFNITSSGRW